MISSVEFSRDRQRTSASSFWERILGEDELNGCGSLEKLLVGCEIIAALDAVDLLVA